MEFCLQKSDDRFYEIHLLDTTLLNLMKSRLNVTLLLSFFFLPFYFTGQITNLADVQGLPEGTYSFNFDDGDFQAYVDGEGWMLWMQYQHGAGTNPGLNVIQPGNNLPTFDASPLGADLSGNPSKWGHGSQTFAASIPDDQLWLRWEAETSHHNRKIHFESPVLGRFQSDSEAPFTPEISYQNIHRSDHTANLPDAATTGTSSNGGNNVFTSGPFWQFNAHSWEVNSGGRWNVDDVRNEDESLILYEHSTTHRVWVKAIPFNSGILINALNELQGHINGDFTLTPPELNQLTNILYIYSEWLPDSEMIISLAQSVVSDYDTQIGALFTTPNTQNGFSKDPLTSPELNLERAMVALQQGLFDFVFTPEIHSEYPEYIEGVVFNSCNSFPGYIAPPSDATASNSVNIRANFEDPVGINPSYNINGDGTEHAFRPTGLYLAPGSVAKVTVPSSLVGQDYSIRVGAHEWDLTNKNTFKRLDRITKKFAIDSTTVKVFNPLGGAISILVPYGATQGIVEVSVTNAVEAPFFSLKSFHETTDFSAEMNKPGPWAVFETDNIMYTIPKHSIVAGQYDLMQTLQDWDVALQGINTILGRQIVPEKHDVYMIADVLIRGGAYSIGYPMSNTPVNYNNVPGSVYFIDGPGHNDEVNFHEYGHAFRISKFPGEGEALVNFLYIIAMNFGLGEDLNEAVKHSFVPNTFDIDHSATHRLMSNSFGAERDISNSTTNEVRYQHRGYAHYFEIVDLFGWCPHKNFWEGEFADFENGNDQGINNQDIDSRILRMSIAASEDLRPLFQVFGILPQDALGLQNALDENELSASLTVYNRLQEYFNLIPEDNAAFVEYALFVYPDLYSSGPNSNSDYGVGWHYQKSLTYGEAEAQERISTLQDIVELYFQNGQPLENLTPSLCCLTSSIQDENVNGICDPLCPEDTSNDGVVTVYDLLLVLSEFGCGFSCEYDVNQDGNVTVDDLLLILGAFSSTCE